MGSFSPNGFGLRDMHGNVNEWTQDCWNKSYRSVPVDGTAAESGDCNGRAVRGGSYGSDARLDFSVPEWSMWVVFEKARSAFRSYEIKHVRGRSLGIRVVREHGP